MPRWGRPPGAHLGRQPGRRVGQWVDGAMRFEEVNSETEDQSGLRNSRLHTRQVLDPRDEGDGLQRSMMGYDGPDKMLLPFNGADYDMYEDTNSTVAYAVQLAMKDNEDWLVETALERIRRAHSEGQKNVTFSKRELEALERRRLQASADSAADNHRMKRPENKTGAAPVPPFPLDTSIHGTWARTTSASASPQSSTTLRSPLQPPFPNTMNHAPPFHTAPTIPRSRPEDYQRISSYQAPYMREHGHSLHSPTDPQRGTETRQRQRPHTNASAHTSLVSPEPFGSKDNESGKSSPQKRSPVSSGDEIPMVEVIERKVPSSPTRGPDRGSRQRTNRP